MSLYSSIRMAANSLQANQIAMQVVGQNIANANTPGYLREEVVLTPAPTQRHGGLLLGLGVQVQAVIQQVDHFLESRLRGATSDRAGSEVVEQTYAELEGIVNELGDADLSTSLNKFFASIAEILNQPEDASIRNLAVLAGNQFAEQVRGVARRVQSLRAGLNQRVCDMAARINKLTEEIRSLNIKIAEAEGGDVSRSDAVGLRDQRMVALENLAKLIDIRVEQQPSGEVVVYSGGDFLVSEGIRREVEVVMDGDRGLAAAEIQLAETASPVMATSGELAGLVHARDNVLGGFLDQLDVFARSLIFEFNKVFSGGQGLSGYDQLTSEFSVDAAGAALNQAGLEFTPASGSFQIMLYNRNTGLTKTTDIHVDLNGAGKETTLADLAGQLDAIDGISAEVTATRCLRITSDGSDQQIAFANDTSGVLAALGLNTFFSGFSARSINVTAALKADPSKFAASRGGIAADTENAVELADLADRGLGERSGASIRSLYDRLTSDLAQGSTIATSEAEGNRIFEETLRGQKLATSGVSLDEEAVKLMAYQHAFNASARYVATLREMLDRLVDL
ncbi:MAG: flagellar hook-associated protein FlgK [Thermoguttaceae bacterium]|jgi:flagellar hook-associated protein 1 FlgK